MEMAENCLAVAGDPALIASSYLPCEIPVGLKHKFLCSLLKFEVCGEIAECTVEAGRTELPASELKIAAVWTCPRR